MGSELVMSPGQALFIIFRDQNILGKSFPPIPECSTAKNATVYAFNEQIWITLEIVHMQMMVVPFNWRCEMFVLIFVLGCKDTLEICKHNQSGTLIRPRVLYLIVLPYSLYTV